ncbi:ABC transporter substrate-binding protein [Alkalihalobacillus macyae]|uniref:ABC transporter substrate-binding protein n=1 Tax=Guptibacillus hwajinpoensis TaxID=208199 RepID=UPI00273C3266|nr:ABC transporter substrate-binding protein [Alkalihalobacillus macyae]MDP4552846.1 ABC transporter substrate-binding protein [Alkalihalobacillus macyae]
MTIPPSPLLSSLQKGLKRVHFKKSCPLLGGASIQVERYFTLRSYMYEREKDCTISFKLSEVADMWYTSIKNAKRILNSLEEKKWLTYIPGKGRGNVSKITFPTSFQTEVESYVKKCLQNEQLDLTAHILRLPIPQSWIAKSSKDIRRLFGYQEDTASSDILRSFISRPVTTLHPLKVAIAFEAHVIEQLGDSLVKYDPLTDTVVPHLAHHYETNESGHKWIFYLRKGVQFHHGDELTSTDVEATIQRVKKGPASFSWLTRGIQQVQCNNRYQLTITLKQPNPFFLRYMASPNLCILPAGVPFHEEDWIGTGPFYLKERKKHKIVLAAFDRYFKERPLLDEIHFYVVSQEIADLVNYTVDDDVSTPPLQKQEIESGFRYLIFNHNKRNVVRDSHFREAMYHLLDMEMMASDLKWEKWIEASSFHYSRSTHHAKEADKIKSSLRQSSYSGETLQLYHLDFTSAKQEADWLVERAKTYGIDLKSTAFTLDEFVERSMDGEADLIFMGEVSSLDPHLSFLGAFYNETLLFRRMFPDHALHWIDQQLELVKASPTTEDREAFMQGIEEKIRSDNLLIFQHHPLKTRTFHPLIKDVEFQSFGHLDLKKLWIPH